MKEKIRIILIAFLLGLGLLQFIGQVLGRKPWATIGFSTGASPLTAYFSHEPRLDIASTLIEWEITFNNGDTLSQPFTSKWFSKIEGPSARRNAYLAAMLLAPPFLDPNREKISREILQHAFCHPKGMVADFDFPHPIETVNIEVESVLVEKELSWKIEVDCRSE